MFKKIFKNYDIEDQHNAYGMATAIKQYAKYPSWLPLPCWFEHAPPIINCIYPKDKRMCRNLMMVHNKKQAKLWKEQTDKEVVIMGSPFVHYRRINRIKQNPDAKGTIVYPSHSSKSGKFKVIYDYKKYCDELKVLPEEFHPISICLHQASMEQGVAKYFEEQGFNVLCAGEITDPEFIKNSYGILKKHKYATSNTLTTAAFIAVEMGLPFFIYGEGPFVENTMLAEGQPLGNYKMNILFSESDLKPFLKGPITQIPQD